MSETLRRLLGPGRPELSCEECFAELDRYVELHLLPGRRARFEVCVPCKTPSQCRSEGDCLGMRAHLEGCPACGEEYESLRALVASEKAPAPESRGIEKTERRETVSEFVPVAAADAVGEGELVAFEVEGNRIAVATVGGALYAFDDTCTHRQCSLAEGELEGTVVTCPCHGSQFDVTTGEVLAGPAGEPVRSYPTRIENGALQVEL